MSRLFNGSPSLLVVNVLEDEGLDEVERARLKKLIEEMSGAAVGVCGRHRIANGEYLRFHRSDRSRSDRLVDITNNRARSRCFRSRPNCRRPTQSIDAASWRCRGF